MARYIDCELACSEIDNSGLLVGNNAEWAKEIIYKTPTSDVVPVVRCRDCKYYSVTHCPITGHELSVCLQGVSQQWVGENHFCSYGERRERG